MQEILDDIKTSIDNLARKINAPQDLLPGYGHSIDGDHPYITVDEHGQLYYFIVEDGEETECPAPGIDHLLYVVFRNIAFSMAQEFMANNAIEKGDYRRQYFSKHLDLLSMLNKEWRDRAEQEHQMILKFVPYNDDLTWENYLRQQ